MDYLARESADLSDGLWNRIDETAIGTARAQLTCRRFLKVFGPVSYTHLRAHETGRNLVCRLLLEKKKT